MRLAAPGINVNTGLPMTDTYSSIETINQPMMGQNTSIETINPMMGMMGQQVNPQVRPIMGQQQQATSTPMGVIDDFFTNLFGDDKYLDNALFGGAGLALLKGAYDRLGTIGDQAQTGANFIAQQGLQQSQFQPFTISSTTGGQFGFTPAGTPAFDPNAFPGYAGAPIPTDGTQGGGGGGGGGDGTQPGTNPNTPEPSFDPTKQTAVAMGSQQTPVPGFGGSQAQLTLGMQEKFIQDLLQQQAENALFNNPYGELQRQQAATQAFNLGSGFMQDAKSRPTDTEALRLKYNQLATQATQGLLDPTTTREADVYERIRATQRPEEERQRLALEERLAQQGRLGVRTAMFGGTPEQLALSKAQEEAQDRASLAAMQQAQAEQRQALGTAQALGGMFGQQAKLGSALQAQQAGLGAQYAGLGSGLSMQDMAAQQAQQQLALGALTGSYIPQSQLMNVAQLGMTPLELAQRGQLYGAGLFGEGSMTGLQARLAAALGQANLFGSVGSGLLGGALGEEYNFFPKT